MFNILKIKEDPLLLNVNEFSKLTYLAIARKLKFLPQNVLAELHNNPSFNEVSNLIFILITQVSYKLMICFVVIVISQQV